MHTSIAVIGLGPAGVISAIKLASKWMKDPTLGRLEINAFESTEIIGGRAFNEADDHLILNMPANTMTIHERAPLAFTSSVDPELLDQLCHHKYLPRNQYGRYLRQALHSAALACAHTDRIEVRIRTNCTIRRITARGSRFDVSTKDGDTTTFDYVIAAVGAAAHRPATGDDAAYAQWGRSPDPSASVAVIGSSLTAVDVTTTLLRNGHRGLIDFYSRSRTLPSVRPRAGLTDDRKLDLFCALTAPNDITIDHIAATLKKFAAPAVDYEYQKTKWRAPWSCSVAERLTAEIEFYESGEELVHGTLDATSSFIDELWRRLSGGEKSRFLTVLNSRWQMMRHSMPLANGAVLAQAAANGQLHSYRLRERTANRTFLGDRGDDSTPEYRRYDHVIDARGLDMSPIQLPALLDDLLTGRIIERASQGGVAVNWATAQPTVDGEPSTDRLFILGALTRGTYFYVNSVETTVAIADRLTTYLTRHRRDEAADRIGPQTLAVTS